MKNLQTNIPDGMRDMVYGEIRVSRELGERLTGLYAARGYTEVVTPTVEYFNVFDIQNRVIPEEAMFKLIDKTGRLIVLRPDNTSAMARIASTRLKNAPRPIKLCYQQNVFRMPNGYSGKRSEFTQAGIEIIGGKPLLADLECVSLALDSLKELCRRFGNPAEETVPKGYQLEIGHAGFARALVDSLELDSDEKQAALDYVAAKNSSAIEFLSDRHQNIDRAIQLLRRLPRLFGGKEVLERARALCADVPKAGETLDYLSEIYALLEKAGLADRIAIDLSLVHEMEYYTGLVFRGYLEDVGEAILGGGRYDTLLENFGQASPATGFGINISVLADRLAKTIDGEPKPEFLVCYEPENLSAALAYLSEAASQGKIGELSCLDSVEESVAYAEKKGIAGVVRICDQNTVQITKV